MLLDPSISFAPTSFNNHLGDELQSAEPTTMATFSFCSNFPSPTSSLSKFGSSKPLIIFPSNGTHNRLSSSIHSPPTSIFCSATKGPSSDNIPNNFSIIEGPETLQDFVQMQLKEIEDNIKHRRNRIFFLMEELRRLRVHRFFLSILKRWQKTSNRENKMAARKFSVRHRDSTFDVDYDTADGLEVFRFQLFSLTSIPPEEQKIIGDDDDQRLVSDDSDLVTISDKLKIVSINEEISSDSGKEKEELLKSDEELARMFQAEEEALLFQLHAVGENSGQFEETVHPYISKVLMYEDPIRQEAAKKTVPVERLEEKSLVSLAREGNFKPSKTEQDHAFLLQLLFWFKQTFRWVNAPPCDGCSNETVGQGMGTPLPSEIQYGATRVELFRCKVCSKITRFPRYNDPLKLVETKRGRCGEWANCFTLYCRAFGYESRLILDFTDHVWTECFSQSLGRWMHLDPCEGIYDRPLLYEKGWNKKLNYVIAISKDGVFDVTKRYTRKWHEVLSRRNIATEQTVSAVLAEMTRECRRSFASETLSTLEDRDKCERESMERDLYSTDDAPVSLPGRQSGDKEWRISRSEIGSDDNCSLSCSSCPVRVCIDEHVTTIYNAFSSVLSHFVENNVPKSGAIELLKILKGILGDLKKSPYKTRRVSLNSVPNNGQKIVPQLLPSIGHLLRVLSLKSELNTDGRVDIVLAGDPVKTSLSLPVVFKALDDMIHDLNNCDNFGKGSFSLPLLKLNRIHSGSVLASGEEFPFGIVTSAFDGTRPSKWEEPNGARGAVNQISIIPFVLL